MEDDNMTFENIPVIIPAYKPDDSLIKLLSGLKEAGFKEIIIVDDGSGTEQEAYYENIENSFGATVLHHHENLGLGRSLKTGFNYALINYKDIKGCVISDCIGKYKVSDIKRCAQMLYDNPDSLILTNRVKDKNNISLSNRIISTIFTYSYKFLFSLTVNDPQSILKGIPVNYMKKLLKVNGEGYSFDTNILVYTRNYGMDVMEMNCETVFSERTHREKYRTLKDSFFMFLLCTEYILL